MSQSNEMAQLLKRLDNLETRLAFQDDVIEQLNHEIGVHQQHIRELEEQLRLIGQKVKDINTSVVARQEDETPPPHY
ncbi:SlyX family protein [Thalassotalea mangrovi]|uniref:Protein SlyX homolog n=1 Tax=Thalassotalea mangrovi TaxID=2572245 RepID=A0A4V5NW57_9GAMM|nr:SlyX family protein [Thalassotalea mangrovi]TKB45485.1 SlyX family protein [Thalassotalea mangrovi]